MKTCANEKLLRPDEIIPSTQSTVVQPFCNFPQKSLYAQNEDIYFTAASLLTSGQGESFKQWRNRFCRKYLIFSEKLWENLTLLVMYFKLMKRINHR